MNENEAKYLKETRLIPFNRFILDDIVYITICFVVRNAYSKTVFHVLKAIYLFQYLEYKILQISSLVSLREMKPFLHSEIISLLPKWQFSNFCLAVMASTMTSLQMNWQAFLPTTFKLKKVLFYQGITYKLIIVCLHNSKSICETING